MKRKFLNINKVSFKKLFIYSSLILPILLIIFSTVNEPRNNKNSKLKEDKTQTLIEDAIEPFCLNFSQGSKDINQINIVIPNSRKWASNATKAYFSKGPYIKESYRKRFNAKINYKVGKKKCEFQAGVRISGDVKDGHIKLIDGEFVTSLDVLMKTGNINGITKFKLFLKEARNGKHEVIAANIFSELGLLSPRTKLINASIQGKSIEMIFQEKLAKEFVEHNNIRESAFIKANESLFWALRIKNNKPDSYSSLIFPSIINHKWLKKGKVNSTIGLNALNQYSKAIYEATKDNLNHDKPYMLSNLSNSKNKKILKENSLFSILSIITLSTHQFINHNRRFYFDPFFDGLRPVYYDGQPGTFLKNQSIFKGTNAKKMISRNYKYYDFEDAFNKIEEINIESLQNRINNSGVNLTKNQIRKIKKQLYKNLKELEILTDEVKNNSTNSRYRFKKENLSRQKKWELANIMLVEGENLNNLKECQINIIVCKEEIFDQNSFIKLARGNYKKGNKKYYYLNRELKNLNKNTKKEFKEIDISNSFKLRIYGNPKININKELKRIDLKFNSKTDKVVIYDSKLIGWEINGKSFKNDQITNDLDFRFDENLLTGSLVIQNSELDGISISFNNGFHEDSINILNSKGNVDSINIKNSYQDALDLDFSILNIDKLNIENAGNDCIDLSSGNYFIKKINANNCYDKGISIGEKSMVKIENLDLNKSKIALVVKDSSNVEILNAFISNYGQCLALYRKKQEFGSSYLNIKKSVCPENKTIVQYNSEVVYR